MERIRLLVVGLVTLAVTIAAFSGALQEYQWLSDRIPVMTLLLLSVLTAFIGFSLFPRMDKLNKHIEKTDESLRALTSDLLSSIPEKLDESLKKLFLDVITKWTSRLEQALKNKTVAIDPQKEFPTFYKKTLIAFPNAVLLATSIRECNQGFSPRSRRRSRSGRPRRC